MILLQFAIFSALITGRIALTQVQFSDRNETSETVIEQLESDLQFSKDIASVLTEAILKSKCDGIVIITSDGCRDYLDYTLQQISEWAPPVLLVTYLDFKKIGNSELWAKFLAWKKRPCSIVFVCDVMKSEEEMEIDENGLVGGTNPQQYFEDDEIGHLKLPKFIDSSDQVLYLSDQLEDYFNGTGRTNSLTNRDDIQAKILKQSGILLQIFVENRTESEPEAVMHVYSICEYCGESAKWQQRDLGFWQRNKTQFGKFFHVFSDFHKLSFNNTNLNIGYFNHPPHFSCYLDGGGGFDQQRMTSTDEEGDSHMNDLLTTCEGVEWEMISQMGQSLDFSPSWINLSNPDSGQGDGASNISNIMILSFEEERIDLAVGGISVTPKRIMHLDFSNVFANDPIVFVVGKKKSNFALGIWLAFNPEIWPLILLLIGIISLLFHIIIYQYTLEPPKKSKWKWAMSQFLHEEPRKPIHVAMFEALEITLQPLLGQPLSATQITHRPRRLLKFLLVFWWFSCLTISTLYNTSLITSLINPIPPKEPETLQDLLDFGYRFKPAGKQGAFFELIKSVLDKLPGEDDDQDAPEELLQGTNEERKTVSLLKQIRDRLVKDGSKSTSRYQIAYVIEESAVKGTKWDKKSIGFSQIKVIRERLFLTTYAWPTQRHAPFKNKIDSALGRLNAAGLVDYWYEEFGHRNDKNARGSEFRLREKLSQITLNMQVLQGAFIFLLFGFGLGGFVLGLEHFTKRYKFRFYTKKEICSIFGKVMTSTKKVYSKHFASEHEDLELRRKKNRMRFRGAVRTVTTFKPKNIPYLK